MKKRLSGLVSGISTNPFQTFSGKKKENSTFFSFDISFDLCDDNGKLTHVWFNRSFRLPPPLNDGDSIEIVGRYGRFFGLFMKKNFYAVRIIDKSRNKEYTPWRTFESIKSAEPNTGEGVPAQE